VDGCKSISVSRSIDKLTLTLTNERVNGNR
jgi:hypothetical protein